MTGDIKMTYPVLAELVLNTMKASGMTINGAIKHCDNWEVFCDMMDYEGFTLLGSGYFSAAFKHEDFEGKVFKFGFKKEDSGAAYAAWCRAEWEAGRGSVAIPKIEHMERNSGFYMVVMPEYQSLYDLMPKCYFNDMWGNQLVTESAFTAVKAMYSAVTGDILEYMDYVEYIEEEENDLFDNSPALPLLKAVKNSELFLVLRHIGRHFRGVASFDLHSENFMFDAEGNIVITDPVSFSHED